MSCTLCLCSVAVLLLVCRHVDALLDDFYTNFFGPARTPMRRYYELCEHQWMTQTGDAVWFRYFFDANQLVLFPPEVCRQARRLLDAAASLAVAEPYRKRVDLTTKAFHLTELYSAVYHSGKPPTTIASAAEAAQALQTVVAGSTTDLERQRHLADVIDKEPLLAPVIPVDGRAHYTAPGASAGLVWQLLRWCRENHRGDMAEALLGQLSKADSTGDMLAVAHSLWTLPDAKPKDLIVNGTFDRAEGAKADTTGADWNDAGAPPGWSFWERKPGAGKLRWVSAEEQRYVTLTAVKGACYIQTVPVTPGAVYFVVADYRGRIGETAKAELGMSWQDAKSGWLEETRRTTNLTRGLSPSPSSAAEPTLPWLTTAVAGRAPSGAAKAVVMLFADGRAAEDVVAFDNVWRFEARTAAQ